MKSTEIIKRVMKYIMRYKFAFVLSIIFTTISTLATLYIPVLAGDAIDNIVGLGNVDFGNLIIIIV